MYFYIGSLQEVVYQDNELIRIINESDNEIDQGIIEKANEEVEAFKDECRFHNKNWFAKVIRKLRGVYQFWLAKARAEKDAGKIGIIKKVLSIILGGIDFLLKKLEGLGTKLKPIGQFINDEAKRIDRRTRHAFESKIVSRKSTKVEEPYF
jgi:vacuolar-type H+-ATPase subunit H